MSGSVAGLPEDDLRLALEKVDFWAWLGEELRLVIAEGRADGRPVDEMERLHALACALLLRARAAEVRSSASGRRAERRSRVA